MQNYFINLYLADGEKEFLGPFTKDQAIKVAAEMKTNGEVFKTLQEVDGEFGKEVVEVKL